MGKTALLHIGTMKTGTTSIQRCLAQAEADGSLAPFCYPVGDGIGHHNRLIMLYHPHNEFVGTLRNEYPSNDRRFKRARRKYRRSMFEKLGSAGGAIISAETLCGCAEPNVAQFRADLESAGFGEFHVVIYIRDPADFYLSRTQQILKATDSDFSELLSRTRDFSGAISVEQQLVMDPASFVYDFRRAVETWEKVFPGRLIVRRFPRGPQQDVVSDFASVLEERIGLSLPSSPVRSNPTISTEGMQILQDYRKKFWPGNVGVTADTLRLVGFLQSSLQSLPQTKPVLKEEFAAQIWANHSEDAEFIAARYGVDLGLRNIGPASVAPHGRAYRIDEIVESVDPEIVHELLLQIARSELGRIPVGRSLPMRVAKRVYHAIPARRRPSGLAARLRAFRNE